MRCKQCTKVVRYPADTSKAIRLCGRCRKGDETDG